MLFRHSSPTKAKEYQGLTGIQLRGYRRLSDVDLVQAYLGGDCRAFGEIVRRHHQKLLWVARRYGHNEDDAHDIVQEALFKASTSLHQYRCEAALGTWLYRLVANQGFDFLRHRSQRETPIIDSGDVRADANPLLMATERRDIDLRLLLKHALQKLDSKQQAAMVLVDLLGHSVTTAAQLQGVAPGTIKSRRARARVHLQRELADAR